MTEELSRVQCVPKAEFDVTTLTGSFQSMNGNGLADEIKILKIYNPSTTASIEVSLDGVTPHDFIPPLGTLIVDFQANAYQAPSYGMGILRMAKGQILWGRTAPHPSYLQIIGYR